MRSNNKDYLEEEKCFVDELRTMPGYDGIKNDKTYIFHQRSL